jgi:uncharacterized protein DUF3485
MKYLPIGLAVAIMLVAGVIQGWISERWGTFPELQLLSEQLTSVPMQIGEWEGQDGEKSNDKILKISGAEGELVRIYRNANGEEVRVSIICARLMDIFLHSPDRCYPAAGFEMQGSPEPVVIEIGDSTAEFFTTSFRKSEPTGTHDERGFWTWSGNGQWVAPKNPKLAFAGQQHALYKLYVFANQVPKQRPNDRDYCKEFIKVFIPAVNQALRPAMITAGRIQEDKAPDTAPHNAPIQTEAADAPA